MSDDVPALPQLEPWQFQPDSDTPGLFLQCASVEQRDIIMRALRAHPKRSVPWKQAYRAGIEADLTKQSRVPPSDFDDDATAAWLAGYDR